MLHRLDRSYLRPAAAALGLLCVFVVACETRADEPEWHVGLARVKITPEEPIAMSGYGRRVSEGVLDDLHAKAVVLKDSHGQRALLVTADLLFFRAPFAEVLCKQIGGKTGLKRHEIQLNASHTHSGPVFGVRDPDRFELTDQQRQVVDAYTEKLRGQLVDLVEAAIADSSPARLSWGKGNAGEFVMNRRLIDEHGKCRGMGPNPQGPVDRDVPVLRIDRPDGRLRGIVFGCACHCVTLDGHNRRISGDYASFAQRFIEKCHPAVQALFVAGCGADANTHPRGGPKQIELVHQHGETLGQEVCRVAASPLAPIRSPMRVQLKWTDLPLEQFSSREQLEKIANSGSYWHTRNAKGLLAILERGDSLPQHYRAPISLWQFGDDLTLVGLPGEAGADYVTMLRSALGPERWWIAAYSNESFGYLPTTKILAEGGHETIGLTLDIGLFAPGVEDVVVATVRELARESGRKSPK
ncbi:MAG: neutral/alkaline non-lysosomal ceramidase N-terminal domain-containing protein [Planctomycetes bacterium]|nr:neutral/alkaline non-lysosomal ceramidase N-terminal domain-containing protein [Planctomycetota bacterium]MBL7038517.1 neutral/alkaline non-lysosomal ceramidase N-terminal domain-containing protein [Pirellulaceae bacterium]